MTAKRKFWLAGLTLAIIGVVLARVVSSYFEHPVIKVALYGVGIILAFSGIGLIMFGIRKNLK
jgi:FtsH-binding integral membrane protein